MVFHAADYNFVTFIDILHSVGISHKIKAFGSISCEDDFFCTGGTNESSHDCPGILIIIRSPHAKTVKTAERICIVIVVKIAYCINDTLRSMGCGRIVKVNHTLVLRCIEYIEIFSIQIG